MTTDDAHDGSALDRVRARLRDEGRLTFAAFMAEALYGPSGYYTRRPRLGGASADFFTSPELHPAFGALLGRLAGAVWDALGRPNDFDLVEHGPGTGALCRDLLTWAGHDAPDFAASIRYRLVETSPALRAAQRTTLAAAGLLDGRISWQDALTSEPALPRTALTPNPSPTTGRGETGCRFPRSRVRERGAGGERRIEGEGRVDGEGRVAGLILANELVDALPVHLVTVRDGTLLERYVVADDTHPGGLGWHDDEPSTPALAAYFEQLGLWPGDGCLAEVNLSGVAWMEHTAASLERGALLVLDYGYPAPELYAPSRRLGTLLTYQGHALGSDPFRHVGRQDITAHVDFTSLARAGERGGLETVGLIGQAALLRRLGLDHYQHAVERAGLPATDHDANRRALQALVEPTGLGNVQALLQTRWLAGFDPFAPRPADTAPAAAGPRPWLPLLHPGQMRLAGPLEAEGFIDLEAQWQELFAGDDEADEVGRSDGPLVLGG